jgi:hypothetical protein
MLFSTRQGFLTRNVPPSGGGGGGGGTLWTPTGTYLWYDASDSGTVTLSGSNVTAWNDKSGNGKHLSVTAGSPTVGAGLNSLATIALDNRSFRQRFSNSSISITGNTLTTFSIHKNTPSGGATIYGRVISFNSGSGANDYENLGSIAAQLYGTSDRIATYYYGANRVTGTGFDIGDWVNVAGRRDAGTFSMWVDGTKQTDGTSQPTDNFSISAMNIGNDHPMADSGMYGELAEIIVFTTALSDSDINKITGYLSWKWGLQANLPAGHPYVDAPPYV